MVLDGKRCVKIVEVNVEDIVFAISVIRLRGPLALGPPTMKQYCL